MINRIPVIVAGRTGRMSQMIVAFLSKEPDMNFLGIFSNKHSPDRPTQQDIPFYTSLADVGVSDLVVVDATHREQTHQLLLEARTLECGGLVIGTSGLEEAEFSLITEVSQRLPVLQAANFSCGSLAVARVVEQLSRSLPENWQAEILDLHYANKLDRPSATAKALAKRYCDGSPRRSSPSIASLRVGDGVSEHTVFLAGPGERIEIAHRLLDRKAFMLSITDSIRFVHKQRAGLYSLEDVYPNFSV